MELFETIKKRRSIRRYHGRELEKEKIEKVLNAARLAPSAKNAQPLKVILVNDRGLKERIVDAAKGQEFLMEAPYVIVICASEQECYQEHGDYMKSYAVDAAIFMDHLTLAACAVDLGTCWIAKFNEERLKELLNIPEGYRVVVMSPLGYPAEEGKDKGRKPFKEIIYKNRWGNSFEF